MHPQFATNQYIYVYYTYPKFGVCDSVAPVNRLSRFVLSPVERHRSQQRARAVGHAAARGRRSPQRRRHRVRSRRISVRSRSAMATWEARGQRPRTASGKIVRLTDDGDIPAGNPYTGAGTARCHVDGVPPAGSPAGTKCQEIYASGLRNPFRLARDPNASGTRFFINDVGADSWEEIDELTGPGGDYGWPAREGPCARLLRDQLHAPARAYRPRALVQPPGHRRCDHGRCLRTERPLARRVRRQVSLRRLCVRADLPARSGRVGLPACVSRRRARSTDVFSDTPLVVEMAFGPYRGTQALYYVSRTVASPSDRVHRLGQPLADGSGAATPSSGASPLTVAFDSSGTRDPDGRPVGLSVGL